MKILVITADSALNNDTFLKELSTVCSNKNINFHYKKNHVRCLAHIMNLTCQEILKNIKAGEAQDEDEILKEISNGNDDINVIPKLRKLIVKIRASPQRKERFDRQSNLYSRNSLNLILDVKTKWNSTYLMLERALKLQEVLLDLNMIYILELKQSIYKFVFY